jgi:hypothetical protein
MDCEISTDIVKKYDGIHRYHALHVSVELSVWASTGVYILLCFNIFNPYPANLEKMVGQ